MEPLSENVQTAPSISSKIYSIYAIRGATILCGPIAGGYMIYNNFKVFGDERRAQWTWITSLIWLILLCALGLFYQRLANGMGTGMAIGGGLLASGLAMHFQGKDIAQHNEAGGTNFGFGNIAFVSIIALLITLVLLFSITMRLSPLLPE